MCADSFIEWLATGPFIFFAVVIGLIVSIDVFVVEFTRDYEKSANSTTRSFRTARMIQMGYWHALFHSGSFLVYTLAIYLVQSILFWPFDLWDVPDGVGGALLTLINFLIVCFIWWTYRSKIREDHSEKSDDSDAVDRRDMRFFVDAVRVVTHWLKIGEKARGVAVAGSVAVDMLAISALLKLVLLPNIEEAPISSFFGIVVVDIALFAVIIFGVVWLSVFVAHVLGGVIRHSSHHFVVFLRILEPIAVFFIVAGSLRSFTHILLYECHSVAQEYGLLIDLSFALIMVLSLLLSSGLTWNELNALYKKRSVDANSKNPTITGEELWQDLRPLIPGVWVVLVVFVVVFSLLWLAYSTNPGPSSHNHLIEATTYIAMAVIGVTTLFLYIPSILVDKLETDETATFSIVLTSQPRQFWSRIAGVTLALITLSVYNFAVFGRTFYTEAIVLWSAYIICTWLLFDLRRWRFFRVNGSTEGGDRSINDADFAELVSALGVASSVIALAGTYFTQALLT